MRNTSIIVLLALALSGCGFVQEPYPAWTVVALPYDALPQKVKTAFREDFGDVHVTKVEESTHESGLSGRPRKYRIFFEPSGGDVAHVIYDAKGNRNDRFEFWFGNAEAAESDGAANANRRQNVSTP